MQLTVEQIQAIMQTISDEDSYLDLEHKKDVNDLEITKVKFYNRDEAVSQSYFIDVDGEHVGAKDYEKQ